MKMKPAITMASAFLLAVGCAHDERHYGQYDDSRAPSFSAGRMSGYNNSVPSSDRTGVIGNTNASERFMGGGTVEGQAGSQAQSDNAIVAQVRESLERDPEIVLIVPNIQISANNGAVVLDGSVQSDEQKRQIESIATQAFGVVAVNNQLKVISNDRPGAIDNSTQLNPTSKPNGEEQIYEQSGPMDNTNNVNNTESKPIPPMP
jgi:hypothetical protein